MVTPLEYKPAKNREENGRDGSDDVVVDHRPGEGGEPGAGGDAASGEPVASGAGATERGGRAAGDSGAVTEQPAEVGLTDGKKFDRTIPATKDEARGLIHRVVDLAKRVKDKVERVVIGGITERQKKDLADKGIDIDDSWVHFFDNSAVIHNQKRHGNSEVEAKNGQIAITEEDYERIPDILENYDEVRKSTSLSRSTQNEVIIYEKEYGDGYVYYLEEKRYNRKSLAFQTMYKKKKGTDSSDGLLPNATPSTPIAPSDNLSSEGKGSKSEGYGQVFGEEKSEKTEGRDVEKVRGQAKELRVYELESAPDEILMKYADDIDRLMELQGVFDKKYHEYISEGKDTDEVWKSQEWKAYMSAKETLSERVAEDMNALRLAEVMGKGGVEELRITEDETKKVKRGRVSVSDFVSKDKRQGGMCGVYHHDGRMTATDTNVLVDVSAEYAKDKEGKVTDSKGNEIPVQGFPKNYGRIFEGERKAVDLDVKDVLGKAEVFLRRVQSSQGRNAEAYIVVGGMPSRSL